jgi:hypothetical protein
VPFCRSPPGLCSGGIIPLLSLAPPTHLAATPTVCHPHPSQHSHLPKSIPPNEAWKHASTLALCLYVQTKHFYVTGRQSRPPKHGSSKPLLFLFVFLFLTLTQFELSKHDILRNIFHTIWVCGNEKCHFLPIASESLVYSESHWGNYKDCRFLGNDAVSFGRQEASTRVYGVTSQKAGIY